MNAPLPARATLFAKMATRFSIDESKVAATLKATAFKVKDGVVSDEQMTALLIVADQYGLNPFTKELFAFPDKQNGIVPVVSVDGWARIINDHGALDGIEFRYSENFKELPDAKPCPEWCEVLITRKDRAKPIIIREYLDEVYRAPFKGKDGYVSKGPWQSHTKRFLRHKTLIQGSRVAFGFGGIYDEDEAQRILDDSAIDGSSKRVDEPKKVEHKLPEYTDVEFSKKFKAWENLVVSGKQTGAAIIAMVSTRYVLTDAQKQAIESLKPVATNTDTGETESLLESVTRICKNAIEIEDTDTAHIRLDDARVLVPEMNPENKAMAEARIADAVASIKART